jgi:lysosomal acid lipase/cholesteryl ester hydrolase
MPRFSFWKNLALYFFLTISNVFQSVIIIFYRLWPKNMIWVLDYIYLRSRVLQQVFSFQLNSGEFDLSEEIGSLGRMSGSYVETHFCLTSDGFELTMCRCRASQECVGPPVLIMHGLMQDSDSFMCGGTRSLVSSLCSAGYDVWLGNNRGTKYSSSHSLHTAHEDPYWNFCIDDLAAYDVPAMINYILMATAWQKLAYIGFSQGSAQAFAALSSMPELNSQVSLFIALAPAVRSPGISNTYLASLINSNQHVLYSLFGRQAMLPMCRTWQRILSRKMFAMTVQGAMRILFGWRSEKISKYRKEELYQYVYSPSSVKCVSQWFQIIRTGYLSPYEEENKDQQPDRPPSVVYDISKVVCPVAVLYGKADALIDASMAIRSLPNCVYIHCEEGYEHLDLIWADCAPERIFTRVLEQLSQHHGDLASEG